MPSSNVKPLEINCYKQPRTTFIIQSKNIKYPLICAPTSHFHPPAAGHRPHCLMPHWLGSALPLHVASCHADFDCWLRAGQFATAVISTGQERWGSRPPFSRGYGLARTIPTPKRLCWEMKHYVTVHTVHTCTGRPGRSYRLTGYSTSS